MGEDEIRDYIRNTAKSLNSFIMIHFDGKNVTEEKQFLKNKLPVLTRVKEKSELLGTTAISPGSGKHQQEVIEELMSCFELNDNVQYLCFNTTSEKTGNAPHLINCI